jgi:hypothetical protein
VDDKMVICFLANQNLLQFHVTWLQAEWVRGVCHDGLIPPEVSVPEISQMSFKIPTSPLDRRENKALKRKALLRRASWLVTLLC